MRLATWQDHLFLIFHILRCPNGTAKWASKYIQIPKLDSYNDSFSDAKINHCLILMSILMSSIKDRDKFLEQMRVNVENAVDVARSNDAMAWTLIDSDGEEDISSSGEINGLKENDIVLLLNQIPLENLLRF